MTERNIPLGTFGVHDPLGDGISTVRLLDWMGSSLDIVCDARQSFDLDSPEFGPREQKLLNYLVAHRHTSPFRGVVFKWQVKAPLFVARQWWKHVIGGTFANDQLGWNEKSFRYCAADQEEFYFPREFRQQSTSNKQASAGPLEGAAATSASIEYARALQHIKECYATLLALGVSKEQARGILPVCHYTSFVWTCSLQALLHFLSLRQPADAQWEIRAYADCMAKLAEPIVAEAFEAFRAHDNSF
jgi:thymidylate synthase (FAD)